MSHGAVMQHLADKGVNTNLVMYATGFADAVIGHTLTSPSQLVYSKQRMHGILAGQGLSEAAAEKVILNLVAGGMGSFDHPIVVDEIFLQNIEK
ncbi:hypothetical protein [Cupriavidus sp. RAF12]|uniref:hypothetical protein n=1 Tax=Cupriavidus sp. RAF12 TaxID=3233050 RepID=UPI003F8F56E3